MKFSIIVPVFNRPDEIIELLESLCLQSTKNFEVIVVEDGSTKTCKSQLGLRDWPFDIQYISQENQGQGFARNNGMKIAKGDFFVIFDSDVIVPKNYLTEVLDGINKNQLDAFGGPDAAAVNFSPIQKAMDFAMTSFWTTGGIRGALKAKSKYQARGFNMGFSRKVYEQTDGFIDPNKAEDIELSIRIKKMGFKLELIPDAFVYHKRKNTFLSFLKQGFSFGQNRINVSRYHRGEVKLVHLFPFFFLLFVLALVPSIIFYPLIFKVQMIMFSTWSMLVLISSGVKYKSLKIAFLSWVCSFSQLLSYGLGLFVEGIKKLIKG